MEGEGKYEYGGELGEIKERKDGYREGREKIRREGR